MRRVGWMREPHLRDERRRLERDATDAERSLRPERPRLVARRTEDRIHVLWKRPCDCERGRDASRGLRSPRFQSGVAAARVARSDARPRRVGPGSDQLRDAGAGTADSARGATPLAAALPGRTTEISGEAVIRGR